MPNRRTTYTIQVFCPVKQEWTVLQCWEALPKCKADGAWMVLRAFRGGDQRYRMVDSDGVVIDEVGTGGLKTNDR